jgi:hypothetical protein
MMGRLREVALCWAVALIACAALASSAQAGWLPPVDISEPGEVAGNPHVVLDSEGNATAVWDRWNGVDTVVESAYRPAGEGWQAPVDLSEPELEGEVVPGSHNAESPQIAVDRNGNVTVLWERYAGAKIVLQSVDRPVGGSWTEPEDIAEVNQGMASEPWIAVDWEGRATAVWKDEEVIETAFRPFAGSWEAPVPLSEGESFVPQAAMDARGDTTAVWMHFDGSHYVVESSYRPEAGEWEEPTVVSQPGEEGGNPHVALDAKGDSLVAWHGEEEGEERVRAAYRPVGGSWGSATSVSSAGEQVQSVRDAVDPDGNAIVAWAGNTGELGGHDIVHAAFKAVGGEWQAPTELSADGGNSFPSDVVFDTGGNAAVVWQRSDGASNVVQASYRPAGEEWESAVDLSEEGRQGTDSVVVLDAPGDSTAADGHATAVWVSGEASGPCEGGEGKCSSYVVQAAGYDPEGLPVVELEAPVEATVGETVEISTPTEGLFAPLLEFGDGNSVADTEAVHVYEDPGEYEVSLAGAELLGYRASTQSPIKIVPSGPGEPEKPGPTQGGTSGGAAEGSTGADSPADGGQAASCLAARATRDAAQRRLAAIAAKLSRVANPAAARRLRAAKRRQAEALRRARNRAAASC